LEPQLASALVIAASNIEKDFLQLKYSGDAIADVSETENPNKKDKI
jgi:hypothetical protein